MTEKLRKCPFCNGDAVVVHEFENYGVECVDCKSGTSFFTSEQEAVDLWNNRPRVNKHMRRKRRHCGLLENDE